MKTKNAQYDQTAGILRAIGHPRRIEILLLLAKNKKNTSVTQIHKNLGLTQSETSRHLSILKTINILTCKKEGSSAFYFINKNNLLIKEIIFSLSKNNT